MNFLNPLYLFALAAVAVPILIHIFSRRRVPEVPFSTIRFLRRSDRRSMVRINVRRLLLLFLRILAVACVAMAFARPVVRGSLASLFPAGGSRAACILLDRSYSMGVEGDGGAAFDRGLARLTSILDNLDRGDAVSIVLFDTATDVLYDGELDKEAALGALKGLRPSYGGTDLRSAAAFGERRLEGSGRDARELYIISDFQKSALVGRAAGASAPAGAPAGRSKAGTGLPVRAFLLPVQTERAANVAIEEVLAPRVLLHKGETAELTIVIRNTSKELAAKFPLEVSIGGRRVMEKETEILPDNYLKETAVFPAERAGWIEGIVRKRPDRLAADDTRYFTVNVREKVRVLLIADEGGPYLEEALSPGGGEGDIVVAKQEWRSFTAADLRGADVVVLGPGRGPAPGDVEILDGFVSGGGKAVVLLSSELKPAAERLSGHPLRFELADMPQGFFTLARPSSTPAFLAPFDEEDIAAFARVRFARAVLVSGVPPAEVALGFSTGNPFVWAERRGEGSVVFASIDPRPEAGELVLSPYFLPLMQQLVLAAGAGPVSAGGAFVGESIPWRGAAGAEISCELPGGERIRPERTDAGIIVPGAAEPGFVTILAGAEAAAKFAVNPDCRRESDLEYLSARSAADSLGLANRLVVEEGRDIVPAIHAAREGREITVPLLLAAMVLLAAELAVAQREKGEAA
ncbi:MAG: BatA and WFA domain-containing protein [Candidatus Krumholzibacteria bacterium]|nr:BatA and WFA domain-containing protein [Candidatus Krumholzibacteria bacterium]